MEKLVSNLFGARFLFTSNFVRLSGAQGNHVMRGLLFLSPCFALLLPPRRIFTRNLHLEPFGFYTSRAVPFDIVSGNKKVVALKFEACSTRSGFPGRRFLT
jgi:hypothetical protein